MSHELKHRCECPEPKITYDKITAQAFCEVCGGVFAPKAVTPELILKVALDAKYERDRHILKDIY